MNNFTETTIMNSIENIVSSQFIVIVLISWGGLTVGLTELTQVSLPVHYALLYIVFIAIIESGPAFGLQLPRHNWLMIFVVLGFIGWLISIGVLLAS